MIIEFMKTLLQNKFFCLLICCFCFQCGIAQFDKFFWEKREISDSMGIKTTHGIAIFNKMGADSFELTLYFNTSEVDPLIYTAEHKDPILMKMDSLYHLDKKVNLTLRGKIIKDISGNRFFYGIIFDDFLFEKAKDKMFIDSEEGLAGFEEYSLPQKSRFVTPLRTDLKLTKYKFELHPSLEKMPIKESTIVKSSSFGKMTFRYRNSIYSLYLPN